MRGRLTYLLLATALMICCSCQRRQLYYDDANVHIIFEFDQNMPNVGDPPLPELLKVLLFDHASNAPIYQEYVDPEGDFLHIAPATYHISAYGFDSEVTQVRYDDDLEGMEVYTTPIQANMLADYNRLFRLIAENRSDADCSRDYDYTSQTMIKQPDHLFYGRVNDVSVPNRLDNDDFYTVVVPVTSAALTYRLEVASVTGTEYIYRADAYITGQMESKLVHSQTPTGKPSSLHVVLSGKSRGSDLVSNFNTFGLQPGSPAFVVLEIIDQCGNSQIYEWNVTEQFEDPTNVERVIRVERDICISPPEDNPMAPKVTLWDQYNFEITL